MTVLLIGILMLAFMVGLFWLKGVVGKPWLARLAYSEFIARMTIIALALILIGVIATVGELIG